MLNIIFKKKTFFIDKLYKDLFPASIISIDKLYKDSVEPNEIFNINSVAGHNRSQYNHVTGVTGHNTTM